MLVADATVFVLNMFEEPRSRFADGLLSDSARRREMVFAPPIVRAEVLNATRKIMRRDGFSLAVARERLAYFLDLPITIIEPPGLYQRALELTQAFSLGGHDACYVALAETLGCDLWVDDGRLLRAVQGHLPFVRPIASYDAFAG